jgi:hypothetical protein
MMMRSEVAGRHETVEDGRVEDWPKPAAELWCYWELGTQSYHPQRANANSDGDKNGHDCSTTQPEVAVEAAAASQLANVSNSG